jgi:prophage antirepressor-like protein
VHAAGGFELNPGHANQKDRPDCARTVPMNTQMETHMSEPSMTMPTAEPFPADEVLTPTSDQWSIRKFDGMTSVLEAVLSGTQWLEVAGLCRVMNHSNPSKAVQDLVLPEHVRKLNTSTAYFPDHGHVNGRGNPIKLFVSREGANRLLLDSRISGAQRIKAWLADEVLPSIADTGTYTAPRPLGEVDLLDELEAANSRAGRALAGWRAGQERARVAEARADAALTVVKELAPAAKAWDTLIATGRTWDVGYVAKRLTAMGAKRCGRNLLYAKLRELGWVFRQTQEPKQDAVDKGYVFPEDQGIRIDPQTGNPIDNKPRTRIKPKGVMFLADLYGVSLTPGELDGGHQIEGAA